jgi:hypothetical protein
VSWLITRHVVGLVTTNKIRGGTGSKTRETVGNVEGIFNRQVFRQLYVLTRYSRWQDRGTRHRVGHMVKKAHG